MKKPLLNFVFRRCAVILSTMLLSAFSPAITEDSNSDGAHSQRSISMSGIAYASGDSTIDPNIIKPNSYDAVHDLQSGIRSSDEIQNELTRLSGTGEALQWESDFWTKNKITKPLKLTTVASHIQNLETRFEIMYLHTLPSEKRSETTVTLFTDRINEAEEQTLKSALAISTLINFDKGLPVYDESNLKLYSFALTSQSDWHRNFGLRDPEGKGELSDFNSLLKPLNPIANLNRVDGPFNEVGHYQYDLVAGDRPVEVSITPRWISTSKQLTLEVGVHESESLLTQTFILVYE